MDKDFRQLSHDLLEQLNIDPHEGGVLVDQTKYPEVFIVFLWSERHLHRNPRVVKWPGHPVEYKHEKVPWT